MSTHNHSTNKRISADGTEAGSAAWPASAEQLAMSYMGSSLASVVSVDLETSWAAKSLQEALRQIRHNARFQQKQMQEKEEKLLRLYESQQQRAFERVGRGGAGSPGGAPGAPGPPGKVRQMFDERRLRAGIDRSYPLEPLRQPAHNGAAPRVSSLDRSQTITKTPTTRTTVKSTVQRTVSQGRTGKPLATRSVRQSMNATFTNGQLVEENRSYEERNGNFKSNFSRSHQQRELEMLMNNHNISDNLDDEEMPDDGIDRVDFEESSDRQNGNIYSERKVLSDYNSSRPENFGATFRKPISSTKAPTSYVKERTPPKKPVTKTQSSPMKTPPTIYSRPSSSSSDDKRPGMKPVAGAASSVAPPKPQPVQQKVPPRTAVRGSGTGTVAKDDLRDCKICHRRFASDRLAVHQEICARTVKKKRKPYDPVKHRVEGTDAENFIRKTKSAKVSQKSQQQMPKTNWRAQHEEFINAIRAAKMAQAHVAAGGKLTDLPPPPPSQNLDYIQCPHCGRRFNQAAAERHIPKCATMLHNKPKAPMPRKK